MLITKSQYTLWDIVHIEGKIDTKTSSFLQEFIDNEVEFSRPLALDMSLVTFLSSAGLRALLLLSRRSHSAGSQLALIGTNQNIVDTMEVTGFLEYFTLYSEIEDLSH